MSKRICAWTTEAMEAGISRSLGDVYTTSLRLAVRLGQWWQTELLVCAPVWMKDRAERLKGPPLSLHVNAGRFWWENNGVRASTPIAIGLTPGETAATIKTKFSQLTFSRRKFRLDCLVLPARHFLVRKIVVPSMVTHKLDAILAKNLELLTPLKRDEVFATHRVAEHGQETSTIIQVIVKRSSLLSTLADLGLTLGDVRLVRCEEDITVAVEIREMLPEPPSILGISFQKIAIASWSAVPVLLLVLAVTVQFRQNNEIDRLEGIQQTLRTRAVSLRQSVEKLSTEQARMTAIRALKSDSPSARGILEEITRLLPDAAWLTELRINETEIAIVGYASGAASLVPSLSQSSLFQSAALSGPIVVDAAEGKERFGILLKLRQGKGDAPPLRQP